MKHFPALVIYLFEFHFLVEGIHYLLSDRLGSDFVGDVSAFEKKLEGFVGAERVFFGSGSDEGRLLGHVCAQDEFLDSPQQRALSEMRLATFSLSAGYLDSTLAKMSFSRLWRILQRVEK